MKKINLDSFQIFFSKKAGAKSIRLRLDRKGNVILTAPFFCSEKRALQFASENISWIKEQLGKHKPIKTFQNGTVFPFLGETCTLMHVPTQKRGVWQEGNLLFVCGESDFIPRRTRDFIKKQMLLYVQKKALELAAHLNEKPGKITLRDTTSRWGSCSSRKDLSFCWKLAFAPLFVLDYIIAHEVAHLIHMNHSHAFWATVAKIDSNRAEAQIWLRKNGTDIQSWV